MACQPGSGEEFKVDKATTKSELLRLWDEQTAELNKKFPRIPPHRFLEVDKAFGMWEAPGLVTIQYAIDNEYIIAARGTCICGRSASSRRRSGNVTNDLEKWLPCRAIRSRHGSRSRVNDCCNVLAADAIFELRLCSRTRTLAPRSAMDRAGVDAARPPPTVIRSKCVMCTVRRALQSMFRRNLLSDPENGTIVLSSDCPAAV